MTNEEVRDLIGAVPHMSLAQAGRMRRFILDNKLARILELGFRHGVSTCYIAHALEELGQGDIVTIDLERARSAKPNIEQLLERVGQRHRVEVFYEPSSYTWRLMKLLEEDPTPRFDLCYLDGAHSWFVDGLAFFLVDRLLKPGGWIVLDDLDWTYGKSPTMKDQEWVRRMPTEERTTPQIRKVYELLVRPHPSYDRFRVDDGWAYARKRDDVSAAIAPVKTEIVREVVYRESSLGQLSVRMGIRKIKAFLTRKASRK